MVEVSSRAPRTDKRTIPDESLVVSHYQGTLPYPRIWITGLLARSVAKKGPGFSIVTF